MDRECGSCKYGLGANSLSYIQVGLPIMPQYAI